MPRDELLEVVRRVSLMAQRIRPLRLRFAERRVTVLRRSRRTSARPASRCRAPFTGDPLEIGFNAEFLRGRGSESITSDSLALPKADQPASPAVLEGDDDDSCT